MIDFSKMKIFENLEKNFSNQLDGTTYPVVRYNHNKLTHS